MADTIVRVSTCTVCWRLACRSVLACDRQRTHERALHSPHRRWCTSPRSSAAAASKLRCWDCPAHGCRSRVCYRQGARWQLLAVAMRGRAQVGPADASASTSLRPQPATTHAHSTLGVRSGLVAIVAVGLVFHGFMLFAVFDTYFISPVLHGMPAISSSNGTVPPADRVVIVVGAFSLLLSRTAFACWHHRHCMHLTCDVLPADGLRADTCFEKTMSPESGSTSYR